MKHLHTALAVTVIVAASAPAQAQDDALEDATYNRAEQIVAVLNGTMAAPDVFGAPFLAAVPADRLMAIKAQLVEANGAITGVDEVRYNGGGAADFDLVFERARAKAKLQLSADEPYQVVGFRITEVTPIDDGPQKILGDLAALPGEATLGVFLLGEDGTIQPILTQAPTRELAIGSTLKLYVLSALAQEIKAGKRHWDDVVKLDAHSLPSGQMQDWPLGTPVTLQTLATMMISISDNTATDALIRLLGRETVEAELAASGHAEPSRSIPFLTTIEAFALKTGDPARLAAYAGADDAGQRGYLADWASSMTPETIEIAKLGRGKPNAIDSIEWFASPDDIAGIFRRLRDSGDQTALDILAINSGIGDDAARRWAYLGFKGGSEPGVINGSWLLQDAKGRWFVVTASWNDPENPVDDAKFIGIAMRAMSMLQAAE